MEVPELRPYPGADERYGVARDGQAWSCCKTPWRPLKADNQGAYTIKMVDSERRYVHRTKSRLQREVWPEAVDRRAPRRTPPPSAAPTLADLGRRLDILLAAPEPAPPTDLGPVLDKLDELATLIRSSSRPAPATNPTRAISDRVPAELRLVVEHLGLTQTSTILGIGGAALQRCLSGRAAFPRGIDEVRLHQLVVIIEHDLYDDEDDFADLQAAVSRARRAYRRSACDVAAWSEAS